MLDFGDAILDGFDALKAGRDVPQNPFAREDFRDVVRASERELMNVSANLMDNAAGAAASRAIDAVLVRHELHEMKSEYLRGL